MHVVERVIACVVESMITFIIQAYKVRLGRKQSDYIGGLDIAWTCTHKISPEIREAARQSRPALPR